ncbi:MAG: hypothetical protein ACI9JR_001017, partial [Gammaproteobacteria bacterium]
MIYFSVLPSKIIIIAFGGSYQLEFCNAGHLNYAFF